MGDNIIAQQSKTNTVNTLKALAKAIENDEISQYKIEQNSNGITNIIIDSADKSERIINSQLELDGYKSLSQVKIKKQNPEERRKIVERLHGEGMTQSQIAMHTMTSQKTISNDIRTIKNNKK